MPINIFISRSKNIKNVVFPKCGWTLFNRHTHPENRKFIYCNGDSYPFNNVHVDAFWIRHPVEKIISAWKNKVVANPNFDPPIKKWVITLMGLERGDDWTKITLDRFLDAIEPLIEQGRNEPWRPYFNDYAPINIHFTPFFLMMREFPQEDKQYFDIRYDIDYLKFLDIDNSEIYNSSQHINYSPTEEQVKRLEYMYREDFEIWNTYLEQRKNRPSPQEMFAR